MVSITDHVCVGGGWWCSLPTMCVWGEGGVHHRPCVCGGSVVFITDLDLTFFIFISVLLFR